MAAENGRRVGAEEEDEEEEEVRWTISHTRMLEERENERGRLDGMGWREESEMIQRLVKKRKRERERE